MTYSLKPFSNLVILIETEKNIELHIHKEMDGFRIIEYVDLHTDSPKIKYQSVTKSWLCDFVQDATQLLKENKPVILKTPLQNLIFLSNNNLKLIKILIDKNALV